MYSRLSTWQTTDHLTLFMTLLWVMVWIYPRSTLHPSRIVRSLREGSSPLPNDTRQGRGRLAQSSTSNIQYEFFLHNWIKLALRWLSTLGEKPPTRLKKKKSHQFLQVKSFLEEPPNTENGQGMQYHTLLLPCLQSWLHCVSVGHSGNRTHTGAQNYTAAAVVCLWLKRLKSPAKCPGWWQLDFGVTFEVCSSAHSSRGTRVGYVATQPDLGDPQPIPVACEKSLQIVKVNTALSREIVTYRRTMLKEAPKGTKHQSMNWNRIVFYSKR